MRKEGWYSSYIETFKAVWAQMVRKKFHFAEWGENLQKNSVTEQQTIATVFRKLHDFLINQEEYLLRRFKFVTGEIVGKRNRDFTHLCLDTFTLENNIRLLEEKASQPVHEFLRDAMKLYDRCQPRAASLTLDDISVDLKWGYLELLEMSATVKGLVNSFIDFLQHSFSSTRASVTLDRASSNPHLVLSSDCKSVSWKPEPAVHYTWRRRFNRMTCVVGCEKFAIGRHFWEVSVKGLGDWAVGIAKSSVKRKGLFNLCAEEGIFAVGKLEQQYKVFNAPHSLLLPLDGELRRIGVSLNCYAGQVNFYDMARVARIFGFTEICLQEPFLPFFWLGGPVELIIIQ
ncbi:UNVERIFIED_CONTAM: hypothetical protein K2H54_060789 [Gekko kuhli]